MQTSDSQKVIARFFEALNYIIDNKVIRGKQTFTRTYGINRWNMNTLSKDMRSDIFQTAWLTYLVRDFMVSPRWLLTGEGSILEQGWDIGKVKIMRKSVSKNSNPTTEH